MFSVENFSSVCFYLGVASLVILLLKTFLPFDTDTEVGGGFTTLTETDSSFNLFTLESILSFFMCFGFMGWWAYHYQHLSFKICMIVALVSGFVGMAFFAFLFAQIKKMEFIPKNDLKELINKKGKSYTRFLANSKGQIQIDFNGKLATLDAINASEDEINAFELIEVVKVEDNIIYIKKA